MPLNTNEMQDVANRLFQDGSQDQALATEFLLKASKELNKLRTNSNIIKHAIKTAISAIKENKDPEQCLYILNKANNVSAESNTNNGLQAPATDLHGHGA